MQKSVLLSLTLLAASLTPAFAGGWNGAQPFSYSDTSTFNSIFQFSGGTLTVKADATTPLILTDTKNALGNVGEGSSHNQWTLLGIRGVWIVDSKGKSISGVTGVSNTINWSKDFAPAGFEGPNGFPSGNKGKWIDLVTPSLLANGLPANNANVKAPTGITTGSFQFDGLAGQIYSVGIDYLVGNEAGQYMTGRAYLVPMPTPEPGTVAPLALGGLALLGLARRRAAR